MSELATIGEVLPIATGIAGYGLGLAAEGRARMHQLGNKLGLMRAHRGTERTINSHIGLRRRLVGGLALLGATAGFAAGEALVEHQTTIMDTPALTEAVDLTYGTGQLGDSSDLQLRGIASSTAQTTGMRVQLEVAHNSQSEQLSSGQLATARGYGSPVLPDAVTAAIDNAFSSSTAAKTNALGANQTRNAGVLIVDDNDSVGNPGTVVKYAKSHGNLPIFVANRGPANSSTARDLQTIAKGTHGKYWHINPKEASTSIASTVKQEITPKPMVHTSHDDQLLWGGMAVALTGIAAGMYRTKKRQWTPVKPAAPVAAEGK